jgi:hypothetical protein
MVQGTDCVKWPCVMTALWCWTSPSPWTATGRAPRQLPPCPKFGSHFSRTESRSFIYTRQFAYLLRARCTSGTLSFLFNTFLSITWNSSLSSLCCLFVLGFIMCSSMKHFFKTCTFRATDKVLYRHTATGTHRILHFLLSAKKLRRRVFVNMHSVLCFSKHDIKMNTEQVEFPVKIQTYFILKILQVK